MIKTEQKSNTPEMETGALRRYLKKRLIARLAFVGKDRNPHIAPVWFMYENSHILIPTPYDTFKVRSILTNQKVSLAIDSSEGGLKLKGVIIKGTATIVKDEEASETNLKIWTKYLGEKTAKKSFIIELISQDTATIVIKPERLRAWDFSSVDFRSLRNSISYEIARMKSPAKN